MSLSLSKVMNRNTSFQHLFVTCQTLLRSLKTTVFQKPTIDSDRINRRHRQQMYLGAEWNNIWNIYLSPCSIVHLFVCLFFCLCKLSIRATRRKGGKSSCFTARKSAAPQSNSQDLFDPAVLPACVCMMNKYDLPFALLVMRAR